tara:strand:+ start:51580 stop:52083 length:504 start_codon:yes stop_codon:yes gene_type:complete
MSILNILKEPNKLLRQKSAEIQVIDEKIKNLAKDMLETMYNAPGIGLAAVQVGVLKRIIVVDISKEDEKKNPLFLINPKIVWKSDIVVNNEEGCLSIPGYFGNVERYESCKVEYLDIEGKLNKINVSGLLSRCIQHEVDHCNGVLFIDHLSQLKREIIKKKIQKNNL